MKQEKWLLCPVCGNKTRLKLREDTIQKTTKCKDFSKNEKKSFY